jgi:hypothetical protein
VCVFLSHCTNKDYLLPPTHLTSQVIRTDFPSEKSLDYSGQGTAVAAEKVSHPVFYVDVYDSLGVKEQHVVTVYTDGGQQDAETHHQALLKVCTATS